MCVQLPTHIGKCMEDITLKGIKRNGGQIHLSRKLIELILGLQKILPSNMMNKGTPCNEIWLIFSVVFDGRIHVQLRAFLGHCPKRLQTCEDNQKERRS